MTVTVITLLKRREDLSKAEFIAQYEERHRHIGEKMLSGYATRYVRRFLHPTDGVDEAQDPDVVMEIDFPDIATRDACFAAMADPAKTAEIVADEELLFDRSRTRSYMLEERASPLPPVLR